MCRQLLEQDLMHSQTQDGMHSGLQLCAGLASQVGYGEVQAALPSKYVGDRVGDLARVPGSTAGGTGQHAYWEKTSAASSEQKQENRCSNKKEWSAQTWGMCQECVQAVA